jgi:hypothetical protein
MTGHDTADLERSFLFTDTRVAGRQFWVVPVWWADFLGHSKQKWWAMYGVCCVRDYYTVVVVDWLARGVAMQCNPSNVER